MYHLRKILYCYLDMSDWYSNADENAENWKVFFLSIKICVSCANLFIDVMPNNKILFYKASMFDQ